MNLCLVAYIPFVLLLIFLIHRWWSHRSFVRNRDTEESELNLDGKIVERR